jgi:hypothetical protein
VIKLAAELNHNFVIGQLAFDYSSRARNFQQQKKAPWPAPFDETVFFRSGALAHHAGQRHQAGAE